MVSVDVNHHVYLLTSTPLLNLYFSCSVSSVSHQRFTPSRAHLRATTATAIQSSKPIDQKDLTLLHLFPLFSFTPLALSSFSLCPRCAALLSHRSGHNGAAVTEAVRSMAVTLVIPTLPLLNKRSYPDPRRGLVPLANLG